ncbi:MAG: hypothetical protein WAN20_20300 [Pseudonocardiaceae bacterium]
MDLGVGLPSTIPAATGVDILAWAREADTLGFASLGTLDRIVYSNHETIPTMAAAAAVTSRARLDPDHSLPGQRRAAGQAVGHGGQPLRRPAHRGRRGGRPSG